MAGGETESMDTGTKVVVGLASVALLFSALSGSPGNDAWQDGGTALGKAAAVEHRPGDDGPEVAADDPWTRGGSPSTGEGDRDGGEDADPPAPADDPWTRGRPPLRRRSLPVCVGTMWYVTDDGRVRLPTDRHEEAWASADCTLVAGQSGEPVRLVQVALNACNGQSVAVDGLYGPEVRRALADVQSRHRLAVGAYGPHTREAMAWPTVLKDGGATRCVPNPDIG